MTQEFVVRSVGMIRSTLRSRDEAPRQGGEGAPDAWLDIDPRFAPALSRITPGDDLIIVTWLHQANRDVLEVRPRDDLKNPLTGGRPLRGLADRDAAGTQGLTSPRSLLRLAKGAGQARLS